METTLEVAVQRLVARFAPSKAHWQLQALARNYKTPLAIAFNESENDVLAEIMSHLYIDPAQLGMPI